jgi:hypothetical protein
MTIQIKSGSAGIQPVYICYGALGHTLRIEGAEDSPWVGHGVSLNHAAGDSSLVAAEPGYGELQTLGAEGAEWKLICPADGMDHDFEYWIQSVFTAAPYKIPMLLGHYRREILDSRSPIRAPVVGDTVKAEITVGSYYTKQVLEGIEVKWTIRGTTMTVPTSKSGVSHFTHTVETLGEQTITAEFHSPYDDKTVKESFEINVYETSPWKEATLFINEIEVKWGDPILLTRGRANAVRVDVTPDIAKVLRLGVGEDGGLNLVSNPPFESDVNPVGETFNWTVTPDDGLSGLVTLVVFSPDVALPWELPCWVMSADLADEVDEILVGGVVSPPDGAVFFRNEPQTVTVTYKPGSPLQSYPLGMTGTTLTGVHPGDLVVTPGNGHTWSVAASNRSGTFKLELEGVGFAHGITLPVSKVLSRILADEVTVQIDGTDAVAGSTYFRSGEHTLTLVPNPGSPIAAHRVGLWLGGSPLVTCDPPAETFTGVHSWKITLATNRSGLFYFELAGEHFGGGNIKIDANKLLSRNLADEADVELEPETGNVFIRGVTRTLRLIYKSGSPLRGHSITLKRRIISGLKPANLISTPLFDSPQINHSWDITGANKSGTFQLSLEGQDMTQAINVPVSTLLSNTFSDDADIAIDGKPVPAEGNVFYWGQSQSVTCTPKPGNPLADLEMKLSCAVKTGLDPSSVMSVPEFDTWQKVFKWDVSGHTKVGTFQLGLTVGGLAEPNLLAVSTLMPGDIADHVTIAIDGLPAAASNRFYRDEARRVTLTFKPDSPLKGLEIMLKCTVLDGLDQSDVRSSPEFGSWQKDVYSWDVIGSTRSGVFQLSLHGKQIEQPIVLDCKLQSSNLADELVPYLDGKALNPYGEYFLAGTSRVLTFGFKNGSVMDGARLALDWAPYGHGVSRGDLSSVPEFGIENTTHTWRTTGTAGNGLFQFKLSEVGGKGEYQMPMAMLTTVDARLQFLEVIPVPVPFPPDVRYIGQNDLIVLAVKLTSLANELLPGYKDMQISFSVDGVAKDNAHIQANGIARALVPIKLGPGLHVLEAVAAMLPTIRTVRWVGVV